MSTPSGTQRLLVFLSDIPWYSLHQRPQHLAVRLANRFRILWIEPATLGHRVTWKPEKVQADIFRLSVPLLPLNARKKTIRSLARLAGSIALSRLTTDRMQRALIRRAMNFLGTVRSSPVLVVQNFQLIGLSDILSPSFALFDYIDDAFGFIDFPAYVHRLWERTVRTSDVITVTHPALKAAMASLRSEGIHIVPNGVEYERFAATAMERPKDLPKDGRPIVGYTGSVYPWFDTELVATAAAAIGDAHFVIIGPIHPDIRAAVDRLRSLKNVHVLGRRPYEQVPAYVRHFAAGMIPFRRTRLTEAVNPVKLYEYSAAGVQTVTTLFSDELHDLGDLIAIARTDTDFVRMISTAIAAPPDPTRTARLQAFARDNDWDKRATALLDLLDS